MASFCYVCGTATPAGLNRETGEAITTTMRSGIGPADLLRKLQRALGPGYELQERIGAGGFAEVFRARDLRLKRDLAVKVLRPDLGLSPELLQRFRREAETIATLRNAHIVPVFDIGEAEGLAYIIMPMIAGESLRAVLDREGAMQHAEVRRVLREAALGLAAAHDAGVVHRDIKPENIMLEGRDKRVLLMDFGISKAVGGAGDGDPSEALTTTDIIIGTPQYMSPEQACGDKSIDARSDQYSLAVVGYRMLAGGLPFEGDSTRAVLYQQLVAEPPPIATKVPNIPGGLANAIQRAMAKEPNERFANMAEFAAMLDSDAPIKSPRPAGSKSNQPRNQLIAAAAVVLVAGGLWAATRQKAPPPAPPAAPVTTAAVPPATEAAATPGLTAPTGTVPAGGAKDKNAKTPLAGSKTITTPTKAGTAVIVAPPAAPPPPGATATCAKLYAAASWAGALPACTKEAEGGNTVSARMLGLMYDKGNGVAESPADAVKWYRRAVSNDAEAQLLLSHMLEIGRGTPRNDAESVVFLRESASGGVLRAQQTLAYRLENGAGIKKDETEAALWYRRAAEHGDMTSQEKIADFLIRGRGLDKNEAEALDWYRKAGDQGSGNAAWQAAQMYEKGRGTAKDTAAFAQWLKKAATLNQPDAVKELKKRAK
jgi:serine/threonine protein kinase/TPR repeat protein